MAISVLALAAVIILVLLLITGVAVRSEHVKGGDEVIKTVYIYLVLFATLMMSIGGSVGVFMAVADIISPNAYYQSFEEYKLQDYKLRYGNDQQEKQKLSEEELLKEYNAMVAAEKERQVQRGKNSLIKSIGWIVVPLPVFFFFQRRLARKDI